MKRASNQSMHTANYLVVAGALIVLITLLSNLTYSMPYDGRNHQQRPDYDEDDDIVEDASEGSPYSSTATQNDGPNDGYEDNEPDSDKQYEETPSDNESQADLERFFEDHLGASDRDGMDKENLPTNAIPFILVNPSVMSESELKGYKLIKNGIDRHDNYAPDTSELPLAGAESKVHGSFDYGNLNQNNQYTITTKPKLVNSENIHGTNQKSHNNRLSRNDQLVAHSSNIYNDEDEDKVYVTDPKKPFIIKQLGGFNPEEDFQAVSEDLENPQPDDSASSDSTRKSTNKPSRDIVFSGDISGFSNDASETDDAAFLADDPYKNDQIEDQ